MSGKYTPLENHLAGLPSDKRDVTLSFEHIERIIKDKLPASATKHRAWWANEKDGVHVSAHAWMDAGWKVDTVNFNQKWVRFLRGK